MDQLLEEMCNAFSAAADSAVSVDQTLRTRMTAALNVAAREMDTTSHLVCDGETVCGLQKWTVGNVDHKFALKTGNVTCDACLRVYALKLLESRLPRPKTPEERVTVKPSSLYQHSWEVWMDGEFNFGGSGIPRCNAEIYRLGLIETLKKKEA